MRVDYASEQQLGTGVDDLCAEKGHDFCGVALKPDGRLFQRYSNEAAFVSTSCIHCAMRALEGSSCSCS